MRRPFSIFVATVMAVTGAVASVTPAQAGTARIAPAIAQQGGAESGIVKVLDERRHWRGDRRYRRHHGYSYYRPHYYPRYRHYSYYPRHHYYYPRHHYRRPGISFGFSFGGPSYYRY